MQARLRAAGLAEIDEKLQSSERLTLEDGVRLFDSPDLLAVGYLANREREKRHGARTYFNYNLRLEPTNVCEATCLFCSFSRLQEGMPEAYTMSLEQAWDKLRQRANQPLTEVHVVNGLNPHLPFSYYTELLRGFKRIRPSIHLKCFTAVEIAYFSELYAMSDEQVLRELKDAGLDSLPGGGAEIFAERVRRKICHDKADADRYLSIHRIAHAWGCAPTSRCSTGTSRRWRSASTTCCGRVRSRTRPAASRRSSRSRSIPTTTRCASSRRPPAPTPCACTRCRGWCATTFRTSRRSGLRQGSSWRRRRCGSAWTTWTGPCRKRRSTTWPGRPRPRA